MAAPSQLVGQILGHYRILEQIGAGGMGVVYRAHDDRLDRDVALKVLPPGALADEAARKRFRKDEVESLGHPAVSVLMSCTATAQESFLVTGLATARLCRPFICLRHASKRVFRNLLEKLGGRATRAAHRER